MDDRERKEHRSEAFRLVRKGEQMHIIYGNFADVVTMTELTDRRRKIDYDFAEMSGRCEECGRSLHDGRCIRCNARRRLFYTGREAWENE